MLRSLALLVVAALAGCGAKSGNQTLDAAPSQADAAPSLVDASPAHDSGDCGVATADPGNITETCAVFASAAATGAEDGSRANPYHTLAKAVANANGKNVYACDGAPFAETLTLAAGTRLFGGFDCATWIWSSAARTELDGTPDTVALTLPAAGALVANLKIVAPSATVAGGSSIAVVVDGTPAELRRCDLVAGDGQPGASPTAVTDPATKGPDAPPVDHATMDACLNPGALIGGLAGQLVCGGVATDGGQGGQGGLFGTNNGDGAKGADGSPMATTGLGGDGQTSSFPCVDGTPGTAGSDGAKGDADTSIGTLVPGGLTRTGGSVGHDATSGQGGGGGGGSNAGFFCPGSTPGDGASGGGGGAGGCAGTGGAGGQSGGSSIGIIVFGTSLTLTEVTATVGNGRDGGDGAAGQPGGDKGQGGAGGAAAASAPSDPGCRGGDGGKGGTGGAGGGGAGGHSIGVAWATLFTSGSFTSVSVGNAGGGGASGGVPGDGAPGVSAACWMFSTSSSCP